MKNNEKPVGDFIISENACFINPNEKTKAFLKSGGFTEMECISKAQDKKESEKNNLELKLTRSNIQANKLNKKIAKQNKKNESEIRFQHG